MVLTATARPGILPSRPSSLRGATGHGKTRRVEALHTVQYILVVRLDSGVRLSTAAKNIFQRAGGRHTRHHWFVVVSVDQGVAAVD